MINNAYVDDVLKMLETISQYLLNGNIIGPEDIKNIKDSVVEINLILLKTKRVKYQCEYKFDNPDDYFKYGLELRRLCVEWKAARNSSSYLSTDIEFELQYKRFKYVHEDEIIEGAIQKFNSYIEEYKENFLLLKKRYTYLNNSLNYKESDYSIIEEHVRMMADNVENYKWLYEHLADYRSKEILNGIIKYWTDFDINKLHPLSENLFRDYYDLDILRNRPDEVMVDCGAYTGDSVADFIKTYNSYKHIYAFEMTPGTYKHMSDSLKGLPNITCINKAIGEGKDVIAINDGADNAGNSVLNSKGDTNVEMTSLDIEISEPVSIIKMDIEGAEKDALRGARNHIINEKPQLLISAYHFPADIFEIPLLINEMRDDYKYYLRLNGHGIWPCDYVLFAV